jgi:hypothetical protein
MAAAVSPGLRLATVTAAVVLLATGTFSPAAAQVEITLHGGVHAARLDRPERVIEQPARFISLQSDPGEAMALGIRLAGPVTTRFGWDAGMVWSRNRSFSGSFGGVTRRISRPIRSSLVPPLSSWSLRRREDWASAWAPGRH